MRISRKIRRARIDAGLTQRQLAEQMGVSVQAVSQWETDTTVPSTNRLLSMGAILRTDFLGSAPNEPREFPSGRYVPLISRVSAGEWHPAMAYEAATEMLNVQWQPKGPTFALEVIGDSMLPEFKSGDIVIIDTGIDPLPGDYVVASVENDEQATFKKYRLRGSDDDGNPIIELAPLNPDYPVLTISAKSPGRIIGTMYEHRSFRRRVA